MRTTWIGSRPARVRLVLLAVIVAALALALGASASHPVTTLDGSNFEIDVDANLKVDDPAPSTDWAGVTEDRKADFLPSGPDDDSYAGGSKEDDACPKVGTGSIPNNKSDLLSFGVYLEPGDPGFLNLFWTRVQEPSGTTLMDFELNRSSEPCAEGRVNPVRTEGDLLIEYRIEQGGATAQIKIREWTGSAWGTAQDLTAIGAATGTINSSPIPAAEADGLGALSPRTFGEAQLDLSTVLGEDECTAFSSAFLKSRASDSFTSALKDFIAPESVSINNCGALLIEKTRKHAADGSGDHPFEGVVFTIDGDELDEPITATTDANGDACVGGLAPGEYTVTETVPTGYAPVDSETVTVAGDATCEDEDLEPAVTFSNMPLTDIDVTVDSQVTGGTSSTIDCNPADDPAVDAGPGGDISHSMDDLEPGTYTCTIVVDP